MQYLQFYYNSFKISPNFVKFTQFYYNHIKRKLQFQFYQNCIKSIQLKSNSILLKSQQREACNGVFLQISQIFSEQGFCRTPDWLFNLHFPFYKQSVYKQLDQSSWIHNMVSLEVIVPILNVRSTTNFRSPPKKQWLGSPLNLDVPYES